MLHGVMTHDAILELASFATGLCIGLAIVATILIARSVSRMMDEVRERHMQRDCALADMRAGLADLDAGLTESWEDLRAEFRPIGLEMQGPR